MSDLKFRIKAQSESAAKTVVKARNFEIIVDEPENLGGSNSAANPVEYLLAAFAGCLNVLGHLVAKEMEISMSGIAIDISGTLNPAKLFGTSDEERAGYKEITVCLKPQDCNASEEELAEWKKIVTSRCPVSDNLKNTTTVKSAVEMVKEMA